MWFAETVVFLSFAFLLSSAQADTLIQALQGAGASQFAAQIQSNPSVSSIYLSSQVQTVFAPVDGSTSPFSRKMKRQPSPQEIASLLYLGTMNLNTFAGISSGAGLSLLTNDNMANLAGKNQSTVTNPSNIPSSNVPKRWYNTTRPSLLKIYSGLGNYVNLIQADIPYNGGLIHLVDGYNTLPQLLSATANANGHTTFTSLGTSSGLGDTLDNTPAITCFIPSNAAFAIPGSTSSYSSTSSLLSGHVIPNFLGYLPSLTNGTSFTTQGGSIITVTIQGGYTYVNNAKIVASNQITENGVAHVVDHVIEPVYPAVVSSSVPSSSPAPLSSPALPSSPALTPTLTPTPTPTPTGSPTPTVSLFKGTGASMMGGSINLVAVACSFLFFLVAVV